MDIECGKWYYNKKCRPRFVHNIVEGNDNRKRLVVIYSTDEPNDSKHELLYQSFKNWMHKRTR